MQHTDSFLSAGQQSSRSPSVFGGQMGDPSAFGGANPSVQTFGEGQQSARKSLFGGSAFGGEVKTGSAFGGEVKTGSSLGGQSSLFGGTAQSPPAGFFSRPAVSGSQLGANTSYPAFGLSPAQNSFQATQNTSHGFVNTHPNSQIHQPPMQGTFGGNNSNTGFFSTAPGSMPSLFSREPSSPTVLPSPFTAQTNANGPPGGATSTSLFDNSSTSQSPNSELYTPVDQLTKEEKEQFEAEKFTLGKIPIRPPPRQGVH